MARITRRLVALALILFGAGIAVAATSPIAGPPVQISLPTSPLTQVTPPATATSVGGTTVTTVGDTTTVTGSTTPVATPGTSTVPSTTTPGGTVAIERVVSVTRAVDAGAPVNAFAVPAGSRLVITDVIITNPGTAPACGASVAGSGATTTASATTPNATSATAMTANPAAAVTTSAATDLANTGVLCVPAQTSLTLALTTGLEFTGGQNVVLANQVTATGSTSGGQLFYHLRGFLISGAV
jgi:hypothetical protein